MLGLLGDSFVSQFETARAQPVVQKRKTRRPGRRVELAGERATAHRLGQSLKVAEEVGENCTGGRFSAIDRDIQDVHLTKEITDRVAVSSDVISVESEEGFNVVGWAQLEPVAVDNEAGEVYVCMSSYEQATFGASENRRKLCLCRFKGLREKFTYKEDVNAVLCHPL